YPAACSGPNWQYFRQVETFDLWTTNRCDDLSVDRMAMIPRPLFARGKKGPLFRYGEKVGSLERGATRTANRSGAQQNVATFCLRLRSNSSDFELWLKF
ncbi:MAG: hypothetical protein NTX79_04535, partial [Candidatus Micrarchaeota archaeon]|nr:hypothetical protein [Candidatus Micrarchaeota archaeon]